MDIQTALRTELEKLATLGSAEAIRLNFAERGIKGDCGIGSRCPVAMHLRQSATLSEAFQAKNLEYCRVEVGLYDSYVGGYLAADTVLRLKEDTPTPVREFVMQFDDHRYPELERHPKDVTEL